METTELKVIQDKITEHEGQCKKIDEAAKKSVEEAKVLQDKFNAISKNLQGLREAKIANVAAIDTLKKLLPKEPAKPV